MGQTSTQIFQLMEVEERFIKSTQIHLKVSSTTFTINRATAGPGGAIVSYHGGEVILDDLILGNNTSSGGGGGLTTLRPDHITFTNSLIENNQIKFNSGGGVFIGSESGDASITVPGFLVT